MLDDLWTTYETQARSSVVATDLSVRKTDSSYLELDGLVLQLRVICHLETELLVPVRGDRLATYGRPLYRGHRQHATLASAPCLLVRI